MVRVALCQTLPKLFNIEYNFKRILETLEACSKNGAQLVVFPELSLTGFALGSQAREMAELISKDKLLEQLQKSSKQLSLDLVIGYPMLEEDSVYNATAYIAKGRIKGIHKKIYLANYGHCNENYFSSGSEICCIDTEYGRIALLISEDAWHISTSLVATQLGAQMLIICSATSVVDKQSLYDVQYAWETINMATALSQTVFVIYNNRCGSEKELTFWGGSHVIGCDGKLVAKGKIFAEDILMVDINLQELEKVRENLPLVNNENNVITCSHLSKLLPKQ
jgi:predicted amidohydrolase